MEVSIRLSQALTTSSRMRRQSMVSAMVLSGIAMASTGCTTTPGARTSIWPTKSAAANASTTASATLGTAAGVSGSIASTGKAVKGQFASMGSAVTSAYGKAKTAIVAPFGGSGSENEDPISLGSKANVGPELHVMNGSLHESQGNYAKALDSYSKALEIEPKNPPALLSTARLYDRQQDKDKAIEFFQRAAVVAPNNASIFAELGGLQARNGNLATAKIELQKAVNLDPKSTTYRSSLAGVLLDSGNADSALSELNQVNSPAMANYQMAYLHFARKNVPATQKYLGAALEIDPNLKPARDLMASMGGAQNLSQMAQQGQQSFQQAQGIYQQVGAMGSNIQGLMNTAHNASPSPPNMKSPNMPRNMQSSGATPASAMLPLQGNGLPSSFPSNQNASAPSASIRR